MKSMNFELWQEEMRKSRKSIEGKSNSYKGTAETESNMTEGRPIYNKNVFVYKVNDLKSYLKLLSMKGQTIDILFSGMQKIVANRDKAIWFPFDLTEEECKSKFGEGVIIRKVSCINNDETIYYTQETSISAGYGYLITSAKNIQKLQFDQVTIPADLEVHEQFIDFGTAEKTYRTNNKVLTVIPTEARTQIPDDDCIYKTMGTDGKLYILSPGDFIEGSSVLFKIETMYPDVNFNGHDFIDLHLPSGNLWSVSYVGTNSADQYGLYFAWGDTKGYTADEIGIEDGKLKFNWNDYKFGTQNSLTKYNTSDGKIDLDIEDDAVRANWGGDWELPTVEDMAELNSFTGILKEIDHSNPAGTGFSIIFASKTDGKKLIFVPAGDAAGGEIECTKEQAWFWLHDRQTNDEKNANCFYFVKSGGKYYSDADTSERYYGFMVRGVIHRNKNNNN